MFNRILNGNEYTGILLWAQLAEDRLGELSFDKFRQVMLAVDTNQACFAQMLA